MASIGSNEFECPVCFNLYTVPKMLPCCHLACRDCVLTWLQKTGGRGECPVCRAPILSTTCQGQGQLEAQVDKLQTDLVTQALADSHNILTGTHICDVCSNNVVGQDFCLQCSIKLCTSCTLYHQKLPATSHHTVEQLSRLTVRQLAARHQVKCQTHSNQPADLFCISHGELICHQCGSKTHHGCPQLKDVEDVAKEERQKLKERLGRMKMKEKEMTEQVNGANEHFKAMRKEVKDVFDGLVKSIEKRRRDLNNLIQAEEDAMQSVLTDVEKVRVSTSLPRRNIENLVMDSPDDGLLAMRQQLMSRLDKLESQLKEKDDIRGKGCLVLDGQIIRRLKADLAKLGQIQQPQPQPTSTQAAGATTTTSATASGPGTAVKPQGAALARVLKVGDRVRLAPDVRLASLFFEWLGVRPGETGTVTAIPSRMRAARGGDTQGKVDVSWDQSGWLADWFRTWNLVKRANAIRQERVSPHKKYLDDAYILCIPLRFLGFHHFYLRRYGWGLFYLFTLGVFGIGWIIDWFRLPYLVKDANKQILGQGQGIIIATPTSPLLGSTGAAAPGGL